MADVHATLARSAARTLRHFVPKLMIAPSQLLSDIDAFPSAHPLACLIEQPLVIALAHLFAGLRGQLRKERCVHLVDSQVALLVARRDLVRAEQDTVRKAIDGLR